MTASNESSVLFSLRELMTLEEQRLGEERDAEARRAERATEALREAERQEELRYREEASRLAAEDERRREERARHEAMREAEVAAAILAVQCEAEGALRAASLRGAREHEERLALVARDAGRRGLAVAVSALGLLLLGVVSLGEVELHRRSVSAELAIAREKALTEEQRAIAARLKATLDTRAEELEALHRAATEGRSAPPPVVAPRVDVSPHAKPAAAPQGRSKPATTDCAGNPDPLCGMPTSGAIL